MPPLSASSSPVEMGSPHMYEAIEPFEAIKKPTFLFPDHPGEYQSVTELNPALENVVDIQELLNSSEGDLEINLDQIFSTTVLDLAEAEKDHTSATTDQGLNYGINRLTETLNTPESGYMTNPEQVSPNSGAPSGAQIITIKREDLGTTSCGVAPTSPYQIAASPGDSASDTSALSPSAAVPLYVKGKPGRKPSAGGPIRRKRQPPKDTVEYYEKRARNNVAVRKSRDKAKIKQQETEERVQLLSSENESLQKKVDLLTKELNVLKSLFINVGASLPANFEEILRR